MTSFTVRVELHNANYEDYEALHAAMAKAGFSRQITSDGGTTYQLPTAEYNRKGDLTRSQVLEQAKAAAKSTGKPYGVLVTESAGRSWDGLPALTQRGY